MNTLTGIYGEASAQYKETNKDIMDANRANEALADAFSEIARVVEPVMTIVKEKVAEMVSAAAPHLEAFIEKVKDIIKWVKENQTTIDTWVAVIIGATVSVAAFLLVLNWGSIMKTAANTIKTVRAAVLLFNTALLANPIGIVIALLAGLVAAFIYLWNNNEGFRKFWLDMWEKLKSTCSTAVDWINKKLDQVISFFKNNWQGILLFAVNPFAGAFKLLYDNVDGFREKVNTVFSKVASIITEKINAGRDAVDKAIKKIKGFFDIELKFKGIKMPSISIDFKKGKGIAAKAAEALGLEGVPTFSVKWNAQGAILDKPTIFGMAKDGTLLGGGEAGKEAVAPVELLKTYIRDAVREENEGIIRNLIDQNREMMNFLRNNMPKKVVLDSGRLVGELTPGIDLVLSDRMTHIKRGNTR